MSEQDGLLGAFVLDGKGGGRDLGWEDLKKDAALLAKMLSRKSTEAPRRTYSIVYSN